MLIVLYSRRPFLELLWHARLKARPLINMELVKSADIVKGRPRNIME